MSHPRIDSLADPLGMMMQNSRWAFNLAAVYSDTPKGEKFWDIHLHFEKEIAKFPSISAAL